MTVSEAPGISTQYAESWEIERPGAAFASIWRIRHADKATPHAQVALAPMTGRTRRRPSTSGACALFDELAVVDLVFDAKRFSFGAEFPMFLRDDAGCLRKAAGVNGNTQ